MYVDVQSGAYISARVHARKDVGTSSRAHIHTRGVDVFVGIFACMYVYLSACMFECACIHIRTHVRMHASLLSGKASFPLTVDGQNPATFLLNFDVAPRAPNLILAGRGATRRSADWPKSCTPRAQPTNIESGAGGRVEVCADAPRARVLQDFVHQPTQKLFSTCVAAAGETDLRAHRSRQIVARLLVIAGYMECDFVAMVCVVVILVVVVVEGW